MKRSLLFFLFFIASFQTVFPSGKYHHFINPEWLMGLNSVQRKIFWEEFEQSANNVYGQNQTDAEKAFQLKELIGKVRDGLWIYPLSSMNEALSDSVKAFNKATALNVYVYSYLEDEGFLNNIFKRLAKAKYNEVAPDGYVTYNLVFRRTREAQGEEFTMEYAPSLSLQTDQSDLLDQKLSDLNALALKEFLDGAKASLSSDQLFDKRESCTRSLSAILALMKDITYSPSATNYAAFDLLVTDMEPIKDKITFITPAGSGITLPAGSKIVDGNYRGEALSPEGVLLGFKLASGKLYMAKISGFGYFSGYFHYDEAAGRFGKCYLDDEPLVSGNRKIWYIKREEDEHTRQCSLNVKEGIYNFIQEYSFRINCSKTYKVVSDSWHIWDYFKETSGGKKFLTACIDKSLTNKPAPVTKNPLSKSLDDYAFNLYTHLKLKKIDGAVWLGSCGDNEQVQLITQDLSAASALSNAQARKMVESGNFNTGIAIYGCYDKATGKWTIISNFKKGSLKPNSKFKGQLSEEKADQISDEYVERIVNGRSGSGGEAGEIQKNTTGVRVSLSDGDEFKYEPLDLFEAVLAVKEFTKSIVENARIPEQFWNNSNENFESYINSPVHIPAVLCGGGDQTVEELTGIVQLLYFGLDLATDPSKAKAMYQSLANMKWGDVWMAAKQTLVSASGYENYSAGGCLARYQAGRHGVAIAMSVLAITKAAKVKEVIEKVDEGVKEAAAVAGHLAKRIEKFPELAAKVKKLPDGGKAFLDDFADAPEDVIRKLGEHPEWVESWKVLGDAGETGLSGRIRDIEFVDDFLKKNPGKATEVTGDIQSKGWRKWVDEVGQVGLANYSNVRKYLANSRTRQYLTNQELLDFEKTLKQAHPDVLKHMDDMDEFDFAEMVRGYRDLKNIGKLSTFENAIKSGGNFYGNYGWLSYWKLTPGIKYSLTTIDDLKKAGKLLPTGNATDIQLASLQAFTRSGDFINVPMRYNPSFMGDYAQKGLKHIEDCLNELRKLPERKIVNERVYSGKTFSKTDFESKFVGGTGKTHNYPSFVSASKQLSVAEGFIDLTKKWAGEGDKVAVIQRIISKEGVYIDDLSDWGEHLGKIRHASEPPAIQRQFEVLVNPGNLKQIGEPIPIMENGVHKTINGMKAYFVDFTQ